jgi:cation transport protein ChaC
MTQVKLTRETILDGSLRAWSRKLLGIDTPLMSDEERTRQVRAMLACAPQPGRVWVFGYGSLMWNPAFHFAERRTALVYGYHREFCLAARAGRGSPQRPGLMLALERGGSCHGVAFRLHRDQTGCELNVVWRREMGSKSYRPVWVKVRTAQGIEHAITFAANCTHERYLVRVEDDERTHLIATGSGPLGHCRDYLYDTVGHLRGLGIRDRRMERLEARVRAYAHPAPAR